MQHSVIQAYLSLSIKNISGAGRNARLNQRGLLSPFGPGAGRVHDNHSLYTSNVFDAWVYLTNLNWLFKSRCGVKSNILYDNNSRYVSFSILFSLKNFITFSLRVFGQLNTLNYVL